MSRRYPIYNKTLLDVEVNDENITGYVESLSHLAKEANTTEEKRVEFVTQLASISRGKMESKNPENLYKRLLSHEMAEGKASRPMEFLPVVIPMSDSQYGGLNLHLKNGLELRCSHQQFMNTIGKFSYIESPNAIHNLPIADHYRQGTYLVKTTMRALLIAGIAYKDIPYGPTPNFFAYRLKIPMFVFNHLMTHTQLSKEARSDRYVENNVSGYWLPEDIFERLNDGLDGYKEKLDKIKEEAGGQLSLEHVQYAYNNLIQLMLDSPMVDLQSILKDIGYKKEIFQRALLEFRYKEMVMTGWDIPYSWKNLFLERGAKPEIHKSGTQKETREAVELLYRLYKMDGGIY